MKLILIHGRSQQLKDPAALEVEWRNAIIAGYEKAGFDWSDTAEIVFPFYGDDLDRLVTQVDGPLLTNILLRAGSPVPSNEDGRFEILGEMAREWENPEEEDASPALEDDPPLLLRTASRGPQNWRSVQAILRALDKTPLGSRLINEITRDVWVYLTYSGIRNKINAIVDEMIPQERCVIVAHSLGTIVAYNVLSRRDARTQEVPLFITLGSPLGIRAISTRLKPSPASPPGVRRWVNARDPRDVVALHPLTANYFNIDPLIEDFSRVDNFSENRHSIEGYLADPYVARCLYEIL
jgi:pimeloyl-ACP methyl ester carboxylesterase